MNFLPNLPVPRKPPYPYHSTRVEGGGYHVLLRPPKNVKSAKCIIPNCCSCSIMGQNNTLRGKRPLPHTCAYKHA